MLARFGFDSHKALEAEAGGRVFDRTQTAGLRNPSSDFTDS
jgi:hypothetical protein